MEAVESTLTKRYYSTHKLKIIVPGSKRFGAVVALHVSGGTTEFHRDPGAAHAAGYKDAANGRRDGALTHG
jgi:hypothetical protein